jgi:hypothetical protein
MRSPVGDVSLATIVFSTTVAGGSNGVGAFVALLLVGLVFAVVGGARGVPLLLVLFLESVIAGLLAFTVGAVVGLLYGLTDALLLMFSATLFRWTEVNVRSGAGGI